MALVLRTLCYISLLLAPVLARADTTVADVVLADSHLLAGSVLPRNGAGIRSKFFVDVYVGALYLTRSTDNAVQVLEMTGPKCMHMHILHKELPAAKIASGWRDGFTANLGTAELAPLEPRLETFSALFPCLRRGDIVHMDHVPDPGTRLSVNGETLGTIEGQDFFAALLQVWIGRHPVDADLKRRPLGDG